MDWRNCFHHPGRGESDSARIATSSSATSRRSRSVSSATKGAPGSPLSGSASPGRTVGEVELGETVERLLSGVFAVDLVEDGVELRVVREEGAQPLVPGDLVQDHGRNPGGANAARVDPDFVLEEECARHALPSEAAFGLGGDGGRIILRIPGDVEPDSGKPARDVGDGLDGLFGVVGETRDGAAVFSGFGGPADLLPGGALPCRRVDLAEFRVVGLFPSGLFA